MRKFVWVLALVLSVAATLATGESQAQSRLAGRNPSPVRPLALCEGLGCTTLQQCSAACGGPGNAVCQNHRCVLL
jgi:hypothetical protein